MSNSHSSSTPDKINLRDQDTLRQLLMQDYALGQLYGIHKDLKADIAAQFDPGESVKIKNPQGFDLGSVNMSSPSKKAVPDDDSILLGYAVEHGYDVEDVLPARGTEEYNQVIDLIYAAGREDELLRPAVTKEHEKEIVEKITADYGINEDSLPIGWTVKDASQPRFSLRKGTSPQAKAALEHFTAPVREALEIPEFKQIEKGDK